MRTLLISIGNDLRGDDGVAHEVLKLLGPRPGCDFRAILQLTPELAADIGDYSEVIFIDADVQASEVELNELRKAGQAYSHSVGPGEVIELARGLYGFFGRAFVLRIPVRDLSFRQGMSSDALALQAVTQLVNYLS
jgi:hydrogenase maturation protease